MFPALAVLFQLCMTLLVKSASGTESEECYKQFHNADNITSHPDLHLKVDQVIKKYGYSSETHHVTTDDGYILTIFRITASPLSPLSVNKPAVLLNHGLLCNSHIWLIQHGPKSLALKLADEGFDVWLLNIRGSSYSQKHVDLAEDEYSYWNFTWHEMGIYDVPKVIHHIRKVTGHQKIYYIGYSMGGAEYFVAMSEIPDFNDYIATAVLYAPSVFLHHTTSIFKSLVPFANQIQMFLDLLYGGKLDIQALLKDYVFGQRFGEMCSKSVQMTCGVCTAIRSIIFKHDSVQTNYTLLPLLFNLFPDDTSTKTVVHFAQVLDSGKFRKFDYGGDKENEENYGLGVTTPPEYDLSKVTAPTVIFWGDNDNLASPDDVALIVSKLRPETLKESNKVDWKGWTHVDFVDGIDAHKLIYDRTIHILKNKLYG